MSRGTRITLWKQDWAEITQEFFLSKCEYTEQEPIAKLKIYFLPSLASTQPSSPTHRQVVMERWEVTGRTKVVWRDASPWTLSPSLCRPSGWESEMSRLSAVSLSRRCQQQGRFTEKAKPERVERPDPARAVVRSLPGGCGRKERGNQPLPFVILPMVHVPWQGEKGPAPELASPPCSAPLCPDWGCLLPALALASADNSSCLLSNSMRQTPGWLRYMSPPNPPHVRYYA